MFDYQVAALLNYDVQEVATEGQKASLITDYVLKVKSMKNVIIFFTLISQFKVNSPLYPNIQILGLRSVQIPLSEMQC